MDRRLLALGFVAACRFQPPGPESSAVDAGTCATASLACSGDDMLRSCTAAGAIVDTPCPWGCMSSGTPHCATLVPTGGAVSDEDFAGTLAVTITTSIDTGDGNAMVPKLDGRELPASAFRRVNGVTIIRVSTATLTGHVAVTGKLGLALVASGDLELDAVVDATTCMGMSLVGGFAGGPAKMDGAGPGGTHGMANGEGGGGGGNGGRGGDGGGGIAGGPASSDLAIATLVGGAGGGGGGGGGGMAAGPGGNGGAAIQLVSGTSIAIGMTGGIDAGGCGGGGGDSDSGGGGGAGGTILLEAPRIAIAGAIAVNGGGGGAGNGNAGRDGDSGLLGRSSAAGGAGATPGGIGAAGATLDGGAGTTAAASGGGGGGIGRIRIETRSGAAMFADTATLSPALDDAPTTCTQAAATVR